MRREGSGKQRHRWYPGGGTRKEAERALTDLVKRMHDGDYQSPEKITVADYLVERWLPPRKRQIKASTWAGYQRNIKLHVIPHVGRIPLHRLTADDLDGLYDELLENGRLNGEGGGLSPKTVRIVHAIISKALANALRKGIVARNVALHADPPKPSRTAVMRVWTEAQLKQFLSEISDHRLAPAFRLAAYTGMRRGEVLGVCWRDVDDSDGHDEDGIRGADVDADE